MAIGVGLAQRLGLGVGSRLHADLAAGPGDRVRHRAAHPAPTRSSPIFQVGLNEDDTSFVFMPLEAAQIFFRMPDAATQIEVIVADPDQVAPVSRAIRDALAGQPVRVFDWTQSNNSFFAAVEVERNVMFLILTLIILVAAFNIVSSLIMMVKDKTRDIAVLRTLGARRGRDHAHLPAVRRLRRRGRHAAGHAARHRVLPEHRDHPAVAAGR